MLDKPPQLTKHIELTVCALLALLSHPPVLFAQAAQPARAPSRDDFAYGLALEVTPGLSVQTVLAPLAVYRGAVRPDLGDVRVFNEKGELLPHALRALDAVAAEPSGKVQQQRVPLFPLLAPTATPPDKLGLRIVRGPIGTVIDVQSTALEAAGETERAHEPPDAGDAPTPHIAAYVLDTQAIEGEMLALQVQLDERALGDSFVAGVIVEASDDLSSFRPLLTGGVLARLSHEGQRVVRDRLELPAARAKFLRLRARDGALPAPVVSCTVETTTSSAPQRARERLLVRGVASASQPGVYDFDLEGAFPVERVRAQLPSAGTLLRAELSAAAADGDHVPQRKISAIAARTSKRIYDMVYSGALYRLEHAGLELSSPPIELDGRRIRYLTLTTSASVQLAEPPVIEVEYLPVQLLFVPRPPGPYVLAFGSHNASPSELRAQDLLAALPESAQRALPPSSVRLGAQQTLAGPSALTPPAPAAPIKTYALWAVLIAATLLVTAFAVRLLRSLD